MKKLLLTTVMLIIVSLSASAFITDLTELKSNYSFIVVNILAVILIILLAADLYKFINITKKNPTFITAYFVISLLLLSSIINVFYFFSSIQLQYLPIYVIDRLIILLVLIIIASLFKKFRKDLGRKI